MRNVVDERLVVYLMFFIRSVDKGLTDAVVGKIQNYYGAAIQSNIGKLKGYAKCHLGKIFSHD